LTCEEPRKIKRYNFGVDNINILKQMELILLSMITILTLTFGST